MKKKKRLCPVCKGEKQLKKINSLYGDIYDNLGDCYACNGSGQVSSKTFDKFFQDLLDGVEKKRREIEELEKDK